MFEKLEGARKQKSWLIATVGATLYAPTAPTLNRKFVRLCQKIRRGLKIRQNSETFPLQCCHISSHRTFHNHIDFPNSFPFCQVYDYDWGLRDDFMGEASLPLGQLVPQKWNDLVLTLSETGEHFDFVQG